MKTLMHGAAERTWQEQPTPAAMSDDAIVKITATSICNADTRGSSRDIPAMAENVACSREHYENGAANIGIISELGNCVTGFRIGELLISCVTACGRCASCRKEMYSNCESGSRVLDDIAEDTSNTYFQPCTDAGFHNVPARGDEMAVVTLSDILPIAYECGVLNGVIKPGDTVAIVGAGPIGLAVLLTAQFHAPAQIIVIDNDADRLAMARKFGATQMVNSANDNASSTTMQLTGGAGVDVAIEASGMAGAFDICQSLLAGGGAIVNIGVHGRNVELHLERLWTHNITLTIRLSDTVTIPALLKGALRRKPVRAAENGLHMADASRSWDPQES